MSALLAWACIKQQSQGGSLLQSSHNANWLHKKKRKRKKDSRNCDDACWDVFFFFLLVFKKSIRKVLIPFLKDIWFQEMRAVSRAYEIIPLTHRGNTAVALFSPWFKRSLCIEGIKKKITNQTRASVCSAWHKPPHQPSSPLLHTRDTGSAPGETPRPISGSFIPSERRSESFWNAASLIKGFISLLGMEVRGEQSSTPPPVIDRPIVSHLSQTTQNDALHFKSQTPPDH